jgi:hypothetical protein
VATTSNSTAVNQTVANTTDTLSAGTLYFFCLNDDHAVAFGSGASPGMLQSAIGSATQSQIVLNNTNGAFVGISWAASLGTWASTEALSSTTNIATTGGSAGKTYTVSFQVN